MDPALATVRKVSTQYESFGPSEESDSCIYLYLCCGTLFAFRTISLR